ncbi:hypothetical protein J8C01_03660 [Chloracidobacterium sp. D]|jgi:hypothetical protein|nr:hypothetical protein J8C01_03660 [Chloracidobacterium sp. D]
MNMPNPFAPLQPALRILATEGRVLPATGQAIVDMVSPDLEEAYDRATGGPGEKVTSVWETRQELYHQVVPIHRSQEHRLRYFLDGSAKIYFIGTLLEHERSSPVQLGQIGAAAVYREDDGRVRRAAFEHKILLLMDKQALSETLWSAVEQAIAGHSHLLLRSTNDSQDRFSEALGVVEPRSRGAHRANWAMREMEIALARDGLQRSADTWLVLDGALGTEYMNWDGLPVIGVAKSFRRDTQFYIGSGPRAKQMNLYSLLAGLELNHRTAVFPRWPGQDREGAILFWYVRIRPQRGLDYPLMGVVKVEWPNPSRESINSDLADRISGWLIAERCVTPHGRDNRWHAHLYAISLAERVIKDRFYSEEVLKAAIRWPQAGAQI